MTYEEYVARRERFEAAIKRWNDNPKHGKFDLSRFEVEDQGKVTFKYMDADTDNAWIGFQLAEHYKEKS